jgi:hypothetical protein
MQRPIILTAKQRMYGDTFDRAQTHEHVYECVQPLQAGRITFGPQDDMYMNNLNSWKRTEHETPTPKSRFVIFSWDTIIWLLILAVSIGCMIMTGEFWQTTFNEVYLTQFRHNRDTPGYTLEYAGKIRPLQYIISALTCFCCSIILGWQSNSDIHLDLNLSRFVSFLIFTLQSWSFGLHASTLEKNFDWPYIMLTVGAVFTLHLATTFITLVIVFIKAFRIADETKDDEQKTINMFWLTVGEDLNLIVGYVLVITAFNALASVHDDTAIFFDVVCVVTIGFLQHIANVLMIFHRHIRIENAIKEDELPKIVNVIARSRLLIFFFTGVVVVFLYLRIAPTYEAFTANIPYEMLRVLAIIIMVSMGTLHSIWFEFRHASEVDGKPKQWESSPTWKLVTGTCIILALSLYVWQSARLDSNKDIKNYLIDVKAL